MTFSQPTRLSRKDLARRFRVCEKTIDIWTRTGEIPAPLRIGRTVRWDQAAIEAWEQSRTAQVAA